MANKKKTGKKTSGKKRSTKSKGMIDVNQLIGTAAGVFVVRKLVPKIPGTGNLDPKIMAAGKIFLGQWLPKQDFAKKALANDGIREGVGTALVVSGVTDLLEGFGIAGLRKRTKPRGNEFLAVSIEGLEKADDVSEDVLGDDELGEDDYEIGDDLDTVNDDEMGDDDMGDDLDTVNEDVLGDDLDTVNEDVLGDDDLGEDIL